MGGCVSGEAHNPYEEFKVTNINDLHRQVHSGIMYVTPTELIYIDKKSREQWKWPLIYLRRYGCEGPVFSFEAGRKCPSGEGLYAFNCKKASALFNLVAENISRGNLEPTLEPETTPVVNVPFPERVQTLPSASGSNGGVTQPESTVTTPSVPPPLPPAPSSQQNGPLTQYTRLEFEEGSENKPPPSATGNEINYTKINLEKTNELSRLTREVVAARRQTTGDIGKRRNKSTNSRTSSCNSSSSLNSDHPQSGKKGLDEHSRRASTPNFNPSNQRKSPPVVPPTVVESPETSAISEPNYLNLVIQPEDKSAHVPSTVEQNYVNLNMGGTSEPNYSNILVGVVDPSQVRPESDHNYTNLTVGGVPVTPDTEHNYTNIQVGVVMEESNPSPQPNYQNMIPGQGLVTSTPVSTPVQKNTSSPVSNSASPNPMHPRSHSFNYPQQSRLPVSQNSTNTLPAIKEGANSMDTYIELDMSVKPGEQYGSYAELDISNPNKTLALNGDRQRSQSTSLISPNVPSINSATPTTAAATSNDPLYRELNFEEMKVLHDLARERKNLNEKDVPPGHIEALDRHDHKKHKSKR